MRPLHSVPPCARQANRRLLFVGGFTVPAIVLGSLVVSTPAFAAANVSAGGKHAVFQAFHDADATPSTVTLTRNLTGDGGDDDVLTLAPGAKLTLELHGKKLAVDQIQLGAGSTLAVTDDSTGNAGRLLVGDALSVDGDASAVTGVELGNTAAFTVDGATVVSTGTAGAAAVGSASTDGTERVIVEDDGVLTATGGTGAAAVGGATGADGIDLSVLGHGTVDATSGHATAGATISDRASAVGAGEGGAASGTVLVDGAAAKLVVHGVLSVIDSQSGQGEIRSSGLIDVTDAVAIGDGTIVNDGTITPVDHVGDSLTVTHNNFDVVLHEAGGTAQAQHIRRLAPTSGNLTGRTATEPADKKFVGWNTASGQTAKTADDIALTGSSGGAPVVVDLYPAYKNRTTFSGDAIDVHKGSSAIDQALPITGDGITAYAVVSGTLPAGLSLNTSTGHITGTPGTAETKTFVIRVTSTYDEPKTHSFTVAVGDKPVFTGSANLGFATNGRDVSASVHADGGADVAAGTDTLTYALSNDHLPAGIAFDTATGAFSGQPTTPATPGAYSVDVTATSARFGASAPRTYTFHIGNAPTLPASQTLGKVVNGETYPSTKGHLVASGTVEGVDDPITFEQVGGELPPGLHLAADGTFSGTAEGPANTTATSYQFTVRAHTNAHGASSTTQQYTLVFGDAPVITTELPATYKIGDHVDVQLATSGTGAATYGATGTLPLGVTLSSSGRLSGTVSAVPFGSTQQNASFVVTATSTDGFGVRSRAYAIRTGKPLTVTTALTLPRASVGGYYEKQVDVMGDGTKTFSFVGDGPDGIDIDPATGVLSGSVPSAYDHDFTVRVVSKLGGLELDSVDTTFHLVANSGAGLLMRDLDPITVGKPYRIDVSNGGADVTYSVVAGSLPADLSLDTGTGVIEGTLDSAQDIDVTIKARNTFGTTVHRYQVSAGTVPVITDEPLGLGVVGHGVVTQPEVTGTGTNASTAVWTKTAGEFPAGLTFDAAHGTFGSTFSAEGSYDFTLKAVTPYGSTTHRYQGTVGEAASVVTTALAGGTIGVGYGLPIVVRGTGTPTVTVTDLPDGLHFDAVQGKIVGTPTVAGTAHVVIGASNAFGDAVDVTLDLVVAAAPVVIAPPVVLPPIVIPPVVTPAPEATTPAPAVTTPAPAPSTPAPVETQKPVETPKPAAPVLAAAPKATAKLGHDFALSVAASSTIDVDYSVRGALPKGLRLDAENGVITGTPTKAGSFTFTVTATSDAGSDEQAYSIEVPEVQELVTLATTRINPIQGQAFEVTVGGLQKGESWTVKANGRTLASGKAAKAGSVKVALVIPVTFNDKAYTLRASGSRTVTDPATKAWDEVAVTAIKNVKTMKLKSAKGSVVITKLAPLERVLVTVDGRSFESGRADEDGEYVVSTSDIKAGKHVIAVTGATSTRGGSLKVTVKR